ncbi:GNAT family N-acetyltransferase [Anaerocolumna sp. AGMB13020]|uniref:GNAT family N-acetyltransferase n=1 Tax=Anaerocolumna sp. AGMB13020 TaxID=3081750 RepID=UPI002952B842|nr:GNAT family N-acetyltransferase [Anaerocolumna sp. AGMB13020]WOO35309.1 GNAT family N-acetyltransferase [Anaerocolumna sp. AGMB13020]
MYIKKIDTFREIDEIKNMLVKDLSLGKTFEKVIESGSGEIYLSYEENEIAGFLMLKRVTALQAAISVFINEKHRYKGIGTELLRFSDKLIAKSSYESVTCEFTKDTGVAHFFEKNGYDLYCHIIEMERSNTLVALEEGSKELLKDTGIVIRNYRDSDYFGWHTVSDIGFYLLRESLGMKPSYYNQLSKSERERLACDSSNRYVMEVKGVIAAVGVIYANKIHLLAVRPDLHRQGYGRLMVSFLINKIIKVNSPEKVTIDVLFGNPAKYLYEQLGFQEVSCHSTYIKCYKPDSRSKAPEGCHTENEILEELRKYGMLRKEKAAYINTFI